MATQLLIYERAVPVSQQRHRDWYIKTGTDYGFAGKVNSVPLVSAEVTVAAQSYPIVFAGEGDVVPVVLLGIRDGENCSSTRTGNGMPSTSRPSSAAIRSSSRHRRRQGPSPCASTRILPGEHRGQGRAAVRQGRRAHTIPQERPELPAGLPGAVPAHQVLCKKLADLDLFEPMQAQVRMKTGQTLTLGGFKVVNREKAEGAPRRDAGRARKGRRTRGDLRASGVVAELRADG